jgi:hypothetical protein
MKELVKKQKQSLHKGDKKFHKSAGKLPRFNFILKVKIQIENLDSTVEAISSIHTCFCPENN